MKYLILALSLFAASAFAADYSITAKQPTTATVRCGNTIPGTLVVDSITYSYAGVTVVNDTTSDLIPALSLTATTSYHYDKHNGYAAKFRLACKVRQPPIVTVYATATASAVYQLPDWGPINIVGIYNGTSTTLPVDLYYGASGAFSGRP